MSQATAIKSATQAYRPIAISTPLGADVLLFRRMTGTERLGQLFELKVEVLSDDGDVNPDSLLGQNATVRLPLPGGEERYFNGYITEFRQLPDLGRYAAYELLLKPSLWFLTQTTDCRIFQEMTVPEIILDILRRHGFANFELALFHDYTAREYCVQYRETDFNFISRLMEHAGIYYYFRHENGKHTLRLCDDYASHDNVTDYEHVPFFPYDKGARRSREHFDQWQRSHRVQPTSYALNDFDFERPRANLAVYSGGDAAAATGQLEVFDYPGGYASTQDGEQLARVHLQGLHVRQEEARASGDTRGLGAGCLFNLDGFPRTDQNREYLIVASDYDLRSDDYQNAPTTETADAYRTSITAIEADRPFRSERRTTRPLMSGPQTATVAGKAGSEIWTDKYGRIKVQFPWDRYGNTDETSSCWIRVATSSAGKGWGAISIPRVGQEVIVEFIDGDPDKPIITGSVFNGGAAPPYALPDNASISTVKTNSTDGGRGFNELRFEDRLGDEQIFIHAEKNQDIRVKNDVYEWVGRDRHLVTKRDQIEAIENERHTSIGGDDVVEIGKDRHVNVGGKEAVSVGGSRSVSIRGDVSERITGDHSHNLMGNYHLRGKGLVLESLEGITLKCGPSSIVLGPTGVTVTGPLVTIDGSFVKIATGPGSPPKKPKTIRTVLPREPQRAYDADDADPGSVATAKAQQRKDGTGKYGSIDVPPHLPHLPRGATNRGGEDDDTTWIELELVDDDGEPVPGERYEITLPDGRTVASGTLDENGFARVEGIDPGQCQVTYPALDKSIWQPV